MFSKTPLPRINQFNFAINDRIYNVNNKNTFYDPALLNNIIHLLIRQSMATQLWDQLGFMKIDI